MNYINLMNALDQQISEVAGVTPQREGASNPHEAVTNAQQSIVRSSIITEPFFAAHDNTWKYSLESLLQIARNHWKGQTIRKQFVLDDMSIAALELMPDDIQDSDIGLFVASGGKESEVFAQLQEITKLLTAREKTKVSEMIKMLRSESTIELQQELEQSEREFDAKEAQIQQSAQELEQQKLEAAKEIQEDTQAHEIEKTTLEIAGKKEVAEIQSFSFQQDQDINNNQIPDQLEIDTLRQKTAIENRKLDIEEKRLEQEKDLKEKELKQKPTTPSKQ